MMKFPEDPLRVSLPTPSITTIHLQRDPDRPHVYQQAPGVWSGCATCGGSWRNLIHVEPLGGWPK
jgi:hypothetical protein